MWLRLCWLHRIPQLRPSSPVSTVSVSNSSSSNSCRLGRWKPPPSRFHSSCPLVCLVSHCPPEWLLLFTSTVWTWDMNRRLSALSHRHRPGRRPRQPHRNHRRPFRLRRNRPATTRWRANDRTNPLLTVATRKDPQLLLSRPLDSPLPTSSSSPDSTTHKRCSKQQPCSKASSLNWPPLRQPRTPPPPPPPLNSHNRKVPNRPLLAQTEPKMPSACRTRTAFHCSWVPGWEQATCLPSTRVSTIRDSSVDPAAHPVPRSSSSASSATASLQSPTICSFTNARTRTRGLTRATFAERPSVDRIIFAITGKLFKPLAAKRNIS